MSRLADTWITPHKQSGDIKCLFRVLLLTFYPWSPFTAIVLDEAATLFSPKTPGLFCELKSFTHPHIDTEVSTHWVDYAWTMEYRFKKTGRSLCPSSPQCRCPRARLLHRIWSINFSRLWFMGSGKWSSYKQLNTRVSCPRRDRQMWQKNKHTPPSEWSSIRAHLSHSLLLMPLFMRIPFK